MYRMIFLLLSLLACGKCRADCCCPHSIDIYYVPFHIDGTINTSNTTYCLTQDLTYLGGEGMPTAAITVDPGVHDIVINFNGFELDLDPAVNGIEMLGTSGQAITDVTIKNGVIKSTSPSAASNAIFATSFNTVRVEDMRFVDVRRGIAAPFQTDINTDLTVSSCVFDLKGATGVSRRAIALSTIQGMQVEDCTFLPFDPNEGESIGILFVNNAKDVQVRRSTFDGQKDGAISIQSNFNASGGFFFTFPSVNFQIDECQFTNNQSDISAIGASNLVVTNCESYNALSFFLTMEPSDQFTGQLVTPVPTGLLVDGCTVVQTGEGEIIQGVFYPFMLFAGGTTVPGINARDVIVRNSTFTHQGATAPTIGLVFAGAEGILVENNVIDFTATGRLENCEPIQYLGLPTKTGNIHLGYPITDDLETISGGAFVRDVTIRGNQLLGGAQVGIFAETSIGATPNERITIEDNSITATEVGILFENTRSSSIINNRVQGVRGNDCARGVGIELAGATDVNDSAASTSNAIIGNIVSNNYTGIKLDCGAQGNLVKDNFVFNNERHQIKEEKKHTNKIESNTVFDHQNEHISCSSS